MSIFTSNAPVIKSAEAKKITRIANRATKRVRESRKPGPVTVTVYKPA